MQVSIKVGEGNVEYFKWSKNEDLINAFSAILRDMEVLIELIQGGDENMERELVFRSWQSSWKGICICVSDNILYQKINTNFAHGFGCWPIHQIFPFQILPMEYIEI